jgi:hypothetical protein
MTLICVILLAFFPLLYIYATLEPVAFSFWGVALRTGFCNPGIVGVFTWWLA